MAIFRQFQNQQEFMVSLSNQSMTFILEPPFESLRVTFKSFNYNTNFILNQPTIDKMIILWYTEKLTKIKKTSLRRANTMGMIQSMVMEGPRFLELAWHNFQASRNRHPGMPADEIFCLVHGFTARAGSMEKIEQALVSNGCQVYSFQLGPLGLLNIGNILESAALIESQIKKIGCKKINFIAHSMGGLIVFAALLMKGLINCVEVKKVILLGSPINGVTLASLASKFLGKYLPCLRQMSPGSSLICELHQRLEKFQQKTQFFCISGDSDLIVPTEATLLPNAINIKLRGIGHSGLVTHPKAIATVCQLALN